MDDTRGLLGELHDSREHAAELIRAKLGAVTAQIQDLASRITGDAQTVVPPDLEVLFPLAPFAARLQALTAPAVKVAPHKTLGLETLRVLDAGRAQSNVLQELLRGLDGWCGPRGIVVFRDSEVAGWAGAGFSSGDPVRNWHGALADSRIFGHVADGAPVLANISADPLLTAWLPGPDARVLTVPMTLRGKVVGALVAVEGPDGLDSVMVQLLTYVVGLMLETLSVRQAPTAALVEPVDQSAPAVEELPEPEALVEEAPEFPMAGEEHVEAEQPTVPPGEMAPPAGGETVRMAIPPQEAVPAVAPRSPEDEKKHEEARRFARLLVSEIRLYNEQVVQEGKQGRDIYSRLKEDIDRSREMFEQRIPAEVRAQNNYFYDELVRILADGDPDALGL